MQLNVHEESASKQRRKTVTCELKFLIPAKAFPAGNEVTYSTLVFQLVIHGLK